MCVNCDDNTTTIPQGNDGIQGIQGIFGGFCGEWRFSTSTASGPPSQYLRLNNATYTAVSSILVNDTNSDSINYDAFLDSFDNGGYFGYVRIFKKNDSTVFWMGEVLAVTDNGTDHSIDVTYILHNGSFAADDSVVICFAPSGVAPIINQRLNTVFQQADTPYRSVTTSTLTEAGHLVYNQTEFGNVARCRIVMKGAVVSQGFKLKVTDGAGNVLWNTVSNLPANTNVNAVDLGARLTNPTTGLTYLKIEYASDNTNAINFYSIDFYNV